MSASPECTKLNLDEYTYILMGQTGREVWKGMSTLQPGKQLQRNSQPFEVTGSQGKACAHFLRKHGKYLKKKIRGLVGLRDAVDSQESLLHSLSSTTPLTCTLKLVHVCMISLTLVCSN